MTKRKVDAEEELKKLDDKTTTTTATTTATTATTTPPAAVVDEEDEEDEEESEEEEESSEDDKKKPRKPAAKKSKKAPAAPKVVRPTLRNALGSMSHPTLVKMVQQFFEDNHPELKDEFLNCVPPPSIDEVGSELNKLLRAVDRAFPNTRYGSSRDNYSYKRVAGPLRTYKASFNAHSKKIIDGKLFNFYYIIFKSRH